MSLDSVDHTYSNGIQTLCFHSVTILKIAFLRKFIFRSFHRWSQLYVSYHTCWRNDEQLGIISGYLTIKLTPSFALSFPSFATILIHATLWWIFISTIPVTLPDNNNLRLIIRKKQDQPILELCLNASGGIL